MKAKSLRGEEVDFDLLKTKEELAKTPKTVLEVRDREDFVHIKRRTRGKARLLEKMRQKKELDAKKDKLEKQVKETTETNTASKNEPEKKQRKRKIVKKDT